MLAALSWRHTAFVANFSDKMPIFALNDAQKGFAGALHPL